MHIEKSDNPRPKKKGKADPVASPGDLVRSLAWALQAETMELAFPFLHFHRHCWEFLRAYRVECDPELRKLSPDYLERENQLPYVVYYALMFACEHDMSLLQKGAQLIRSRSAPSSKANNKTIINLTTNYLQLPIEVRVEED